MKRLCLAVLVAQLLCISCHSPPADAKEPTALHDAEPLFAAGRYDAALAKYDAALHAGGDERNHLRALIGAIECEIGLGKTEAAIDRARAAAPPVDATLRGLWALSRFKLLVTARRTFGYGNESEEGATGAGKLSEAAVKREIEAAMQSLWSDRRALARSPLGDWKDFVTLADVDFVRYPSLWDFVASELEDYLRFQPTGAAPSDPLAFTTEHFAGTFDDKQPMPVREAALAEAGAELEGGHVDRAVAAERWRVTRVLFGEISQSDRAQRSFRQAAVARLAGWAATMKTPIGRAAAADAAARILNGDERRVEALALIDRVLPATPESDVAVSLRQQRADIVRPELHLTATTTRHGQK
ncbi:MAG TPA: hypothetical protein VHB97_24740, partial [Polyangia bacterium]|nr:hypothetical protein [Polyangia bacterium]